MDVVKGMYICKKSNIIGNMATTAVDLLLDGLLNLQKEQRRKITDKQFAEYLGEDPSVFSLMMNGKRRVSKNKLVKFGSLLHDNRFFVLAGEEPPDPILDKLKTNWKTYDETFRKSLLQQAEDYERKKRKK